MRKSNVYRWNGVKHDAFCCHGLEGPHLVIHFDSSDSFLVLTLHLRDDCFVIGPLVLDLLLSDLVNLFVSLTRFITGGLGRVEVWERGSVGVSPTTIKSDHYYQVRSNVTSRSRTVNSNSTDSYSDSS